MKRTIAISLSVFLTVPLITSCSSQQPEKNGSDLSEPIVVQDESMPGSIKTTWNCVYFGSYPTCEIVADDFNAVDDYAYSKDDVISDKTLYEKLVTSNWTDDETVLGGIKYRRVKNDGSAERLQHYHFDETSDYSYFAYKPIKWRIIENNESNVMLMADRQLDSMAYNTTANSVHWEDCTLRSFLNGYGSESNSDGIDFSKRPQDSFFNTAFSEEERDSIVKTKLTNPDNYYFATDCGRNTEDYVFILDELEVFAGEKAQRHGFTNSDGYADAGRRFKPTLYAMAKGAWYSPLSGNGFWFLRTSGYTAANVDYICDFGSVYNRGTYVTVSDSGIIPVISVDISTAKLSKAKPVSSDEILNGQKSDGESSSSTKETNDTPNTVTVSGKTLSEPVTVVDESLSSGLKTTWDCIYYGEYPTSEVVGKRFDAVYEYAKDGDVIENQELFKELESAEWTDNETVIDDHKYRRITANDSLNPSFIEGQYYKWDEENAYHYFRYEPIKWRIIEINGSEAELIADRQLDCSPYNTVSDDVQWQQSTMRSFLNGYGSNKNKTGAAYDKKPQDSFLGTAFTKEEQDCIIEGMIENPDNPRYKTPCGDSVNDKVFILSSDEVFGSSASRHGFYQGGGIDDPARRFRPTMYAKAKGTWYSLVDGYKGNAFWFMRTNGYTLSNASYICDFGYLYTRGTDVSCSDSGVLPVIRLDLSKAQITPAEKAESGKY